MFGSCDALCVQTAGCPVCADCRLPCVSGPPGYCRMAGLVYVDPRVHGLPEQPQPASDNSHNHPTQISLRAFNGACLAVLTPAAPMELSGTFTLQELGGTECLGPFLLLSLWLIPSSRRKHYHYQFPWIQWQDFCDSVLQSLSIYVVIISAGECSLWLHTNRWCQKWKELREKYKGRKKTFKN